MKLRRGKSYDYDVAVIGGGSAGYAAARTLVAGGKRVVVIEGGRELGGLCILRGCMPTKALLYAAEVRHLAMRGATWGLKPGKTMPFDFGAVMRRKDRMISGFAGYRRDQLESGRFKLVRSHARFVDAHTVLIEKGERLTAEHFVIATGSRISRSPVRALDDVDYLNSDSALKLKRLPKSLIILGGGAIAVEFAQFFARFDTRVTLLQRSPTILKEFDAAASDAVRSALERDGIRVITDTALIGAQTVSKTRKRVEFRHGNKPRSVEAEEIFFALGRSPNITALELENARVTVDGGRIVTDDRMRTSVSNIFAAGDCTGPHEIVHIAIQQGETAARNILNPRRPARMDYRLGLEVVFTDPQIGSVGLTEKAAKEQKIPVIAASYPFNDHGKSMIMDVKDGFVKLLADPKTGEILGGSCVGPHGGELIHEIVVAMSKRMTVAELAAVPHYHPTLAEIWTYPAEELAERVLGA